MHTYEKLLVENKAWAAEKIATDPHYFDRLSHLQSPEFLWIGCSDSRVTAEELTGTKPGQMFVHRNIANLVPNNDNSSMSVIVYAVEQLQEDGRRPYEEDVARAVRADHEDAPHDAPPAAYSSTRSTAAPRSRATSQRRSNAPTQADWSTVTSSRATS